MPLLPASLGNDRQATPPMDPARADDAGASAESLKLLVAGCQHYTIKQWSVGDAPAPVPSDAHTGGALGSGTLHCVTRRFDESEVVELFIGQLPYGVEPIGLLELFQLLLNVGKASQKRPVVYRLKTGWQPTCAFVAVGAPYAEALLSHSKRLLCDRTGFWVAPVGDSTALAALTKASEDRHRCPVEGLPSVPMVIERIKEGKLGTRCHRAARRTPPSTPHPLPPPSYPAFQLPLLPQYIMVEPNGYQSGFPSAPTLTIGRTLSSPYVKDQQRPACSPLLPQDVGSIGQGYVGAAAPHSPIYFWCAAPTETTVGGR